jgi:Mg-chelatase subunit ChlD
VKITVKNSSDFRPLNGDFATTSLVELSPSGSLGRVPANVVFLVDASSSMGGSKWSMVKSAVGELVDSMKDDDRIGLVLFGSTAKEVFPLASLSANRAAMKEAVEKLANPSGVTNLDAGLKAAYAAFEARDRADRVKRVNHVILLTDGFPTDKHGYRVDDSSTYEEIVRRQEHITLTGVGIGSADDYDSSFISKLSELGRGSYYHANDLTKFKEGMKAEMQKLQSSVVGDLTLKFSAVGGRIMRIARVAPEIVVYDIPGNAKSFDLPTGSMQRDTTSFLVTTSTSGTGNPGDELPLFALEASYDGKLTDKVSVVVKTSDRDSDWMQLDPDVLRMSQILQVHLNGEQIQQSLAKGDKAKATRLIENTTRIASSLGQEKVTRALTRLAGDLKTGKSVSDDLATIKDEAKKTRLLVR